MTKILAGVSCLHYVILLLACLVLDLGGTGGGVKSLVDADSEDKVFKEASTRWARDPVFIREDDLFGSVTLPFRVCGGGRMCRLMLEREASTRADDRTTLRLFSSGALSSSSAELFKDDSGSSTVSLVSGFTMALGFCRLPLGMVANRSRLAISSGLPPIWLTRFLILFGFVRGYERFFPMTEAGIDSDAEGGSEDVGVRRDESPSAVVSVDSRLGTTEAPEAKEAGRLGRS